MRPALCFALLALIATASAKQVLVDTVYGTVLGTHNDQGAYAFKGVPYAAPPTGKLRFMPPQEVPSWNGTLNATNFAPGCLGGCSPSAFPKPDLMCPATISEDCLFLNVYTPTLNTSAALPVIMFMHGGNYLSGSGGVPIYDGGNLAKTQDVVVVTINYRLGLLGGLFTGTINGNLQTMDQRQSLIWIQKTISSFGGDPTRVTLTGQSAGAFSVAVHLSSPKSWPYFQRAIIESNPASLLAAEPEQALSLGKKALEKLGCPTGGQPEIDCLQAQNATDLMILGQKDQYFPWPNQILAEMMRWVPVVDGDQLPYQPITAITTNHTNPVPVFFGTVANESVEFIYDLYPKPMSNIEYHLTVDAIFGLKLAHKIHEEYGDIPKEFKHDARNFLTVIATDYLFYCVNRMLGRALTSTRDTFMYFFDIAPAWNKWSFGKTMPWCVNHVCHASDLVFVYFPFQSPDVKDLPNVPQPSERDTKLAAFIQTAWANVARSGNPNGPVPLPLFDNVTGISFPRFSEKNILVNESAPLSMLTGYRDKQCDFWDKQGYMRN